MSGTFEVDGNQVTVAFRYTANLTKAQTVIIDAAHWLWSGTEEDWEQLSNQDKLDLVDTHVRKTIIKIATTHIRSVGETAARIQSEQDAEDNYEL